MPADTLSLAGKAALITGSGRENGVGAGIARAFARNGAAVAIHYFTAKERAEQVAAGITRDFGTKVTVVSGSIADRAASRNMMQQALDGLGVDHIDILVNNSGGGSSLPLMEETPERLDEIFGLNVYGATFMTQAAVSIGKMPRGGRVINVGSVVSKMGLEVAALFAAAKSAQDSLTTAWAGELGDKYGITVNMLALGPVPTDMSHQYLIAPDGGPSEISKSFLAKTRAEQRLGTVDDVADFALLLASEKSRWITGQYISVSGGVTGTM